MRTRTHTHTCMYTCYSSVHVSSGSTSLPNAFPALPGRPHRSDMAAVTMFDEAMTQFGGKDWRYDIKGEATTKEVQPDSQTITLQDFISHAVRPTTNLRTLWTLIDVVDNVVIPAGWTISQLAERVASGEADPGLPANLTPNKQLEPNIKIQVVVLKGEGNTVTVVKQYLLSNCLSKATV